jgi:hypothetical protein
LSNSLATCSVGIERYAPGSASAMPVMRLENCVGKL